MKRSVFISGGGPAGLAAALLFDRLGWDEVVLAEKRASPEDFEKNKSFNYLIEARGQKLLERLGIVDRLDNCGVAMNSFVVTTIPPKGKSSTKVVPIVDPDRPTCYWTTRRALLTMLHDALGELASERVKILFCHEVVAIRADPGNAATVEVRNAKGETLTFHPRLILGCDGLNSVVRSEAGELEQVDSHHFEMIAGNSISAGLRYKVLNLPAHFVAGDGTPIDDHRMTYVIPSRYKGKRRACQLFAFPVADPTHMRSVNLIREAGHVLWTLTTPDALFAYLEDSFPQLDIRALVSREEAEDFVTLAPGTFPQPQYASNLHVTIGPLDSPTEVVLIGDAAHAFPPDLGLGVNAALQDLTILAEEFERHPSVARATASYSDLRLPESRDLVWVVQETWPEQYNHRPWRLRAWALGFFARRALHAILPSLFDKPAVFVAQDPLMTYGEMRRRKVRNDRNVRYVGLAAAALIVGLVASWVWGIH